MESMLANAEIVRRFLELKHQVHPDVVSYIREQNDPALIDRITAGVPDGTLVVSTEHIPGLKKVRDGTRFLADPELEVIMGSAGTTGSITGHEDAVHYFRNRYNCLSSMIRSRMTTMPIEALTKCPPPLPGRGMQHHRDGSRCPDDCQRAPPHRDGGPDRGDAGALQ